MRVYEFAKKYDISSKQVLDALQKEGFQIKNHMSVLEEQALDLLLKKFTPPVASQSVVKEVTAAQGKKVVSSKSKPVSKKFSGRRPHGSKEFVSVKEKKPAQLLLRESSVADIANQLQEAPSQVIVTLLRWGIVATINQILSVDIIQRLAQHFNVPMVELDQTLVLEKNFDQDSSKFEIRPPIVVVVGHVDHGKTTLLDFIRSTHVALKEKGGITQHLGAYEVKTGHGDIVFLDTPGHEAFEKIRQRGVRVADIVVLVVAADDGVMPQTVECIKRAKEMSVPIVVAINKVDKVDPARIEAVKQQLSQYNVLAEDWGGDVICVPISAKSGLGVDQLLEMLALQAEVLELRSSYQGFARGYVLEAKIEKGRGSAATVILQSGILRIGDYFICGNSGGRVTNLINSSLESKKEVGPAIPIRVFGFDHLPQAGDLLEVVVDRNAYKESIDRFKSDSKTSSGTSSEVSALNLVVKADTHSSREALADSVAKLSHKLGEVIHVVFSGVGPITENDVEFAYNTGSAIIGLHIKPEPKSTLLAQRRNVVIQYNDIIYKLLDWVTKEVESKREAVIERVKIGTAEVLRVFDIKGTGVIAGCKIVSGRFVRKGYVIALRDNQKIAEGKITSLQRDKKSIQTVESGFECGFIVENITNWAVGDIAECYIDEIKK